MATVMLIDDDADEHELFQQQLAEFDKSIELISAHDGQEALKMLGKAIPEFIFLDINMPKMNGLQVLKQLKDDTGLKEIPVYIYSTSDGFNSKKPAIKLGAVNYFKKPGNPQELQNIFKAVLGNPNE
ncbi:MAG: response regulator [Parafilimonas sp.]|nr:response regulator [Parafilimonas sp.]